MGGSITHKWNGTILTITSDSGTSSADLRGEKGDDGVRGPQGAPGMSVAGGGSNLSNVKDYGATGDGVTDDTESIASAIAELPVGGTLYFPEGVYRVSNIVVKSNMTVKGDGWASVIKLLDATTDYHWHNNCLTIRNVENVIVRDIKLDGNRATQQATAEAQDQRLNGLFITSASNVFVENVWMYNNGYHGCIMVSADNIVFSKCRASENGFRPIHGHTQIYNCTISNCVCENNGLGLTGGSGFNNDSIFFFGAQRVVINDNIVRSNRRGCITVGSEQDSTSEEKRIASSDITITGNICECYEDLAPVKTEDSDTGVYKFSSMGIYVYGGKHSMKNVTISGNTIKNAHEAIYLVCSEDSTASLNASVTGNTIINCSFGVYAVKVSDVTITGNQFNNLKEQLMYLQNVERFLIHGNNAYAPNTNEYRLCRIHSSNGVTVSNNQFISNAQIAVYAPDSNTNVVVINNILSGFTTESPVTNTNGTTQGNVILQATIEPEEPDVPVEPDEPVIETEKICVSPYVNNGFVRDTLVNPNTTSTNYLYTTPVEITDADTKYELNTFSAIPSTYTNPEEYTAAVNTAIVFLSGTELSSAVGIVNLKGGNGTLTYNGFIAGTPNNIWGVVISITAEEVKALFPAATHVMMQVQTVYADIENLPADYHKLNDGQAYIYKVKE